MVLFGNIVGVNTQTTVSSGSGITTKVTLSNFLSRHLEAIKHLNDLKAWR